MTDPVRIIETAYDLDADDDTLWLARLSREVRRDLEPAGPPFLAWTYLVDRTGYVHLQAVAHEGIGDVGSRTLSVDLDSAGQDLLAGFHLRAGIHYVTRALHAPQGSPLALYCDRSFEALGASDMLAVVSVDPSRHGCIIGLLQKASGDIHPLVRQRWQRLGTHIAAAYRLRQKLAGRTRFSARMEQAEAILEASGKVSHAAGPATLRGPRDQLRAAVRAMERARGPLRAENSEEALDAWQGLVAGRWSLVDVFDTDGRRYVVAHRNDPEVTDPRGLTPRERQVLGYADLGRSNKEIAYELGLSEATVAVHLHRACLKLASLRS
ncbi:MAG: LuxR C-terminal-related transcriptional regulator [Myxococcales bacterium]